MNALESAIYAACTGAAALAALLASSSAVYFRLAPQTAAYPLVLFDYVSEVEDNLVQGSRSKQFLYQIKGVIQDKQGAGASPTMKDAGAIDVQIDALFHNKQLTVTGWVNFWTVRESGIRLEELAPGGKRFYHAGAVYRFRLAT